MQIKIYVIKIHVANYKPITIADSVSKLVEKYVKAD